MRNFTKETTIKYYWKGREIAFKPYGKRFDSLAWIDEKSGRLEFSIYDDFIGSESVALEFIEDCKRFAEAISGTACKECEVGYGHISMVSIAPIKSIFS